MTTKHGKARRTRAARARARARAAGRQATSTSMSTAQPCEKHVATAVKEREVPAAPAARVAEAPAAEALPPKPRRAGGRRRRRLVARLRDAAARRLDRVQALDAVLLRAGLAFVFVYAALASFADPSRFERYLPAMLSHPWVTHWCLPVFASYELVLAAALVLGRRLVLTSTLAAITVAGITVANPDEFDVLFRNIAITCAALSLAVRCRPAAAEAATVIVLPD